MNEALEATGSAVGAESVTGVRETDVMDIGNLKAKLASEQAVVGVIGLGYVGLPLGLPPRTRQDHQSVRSI